VGLLLPQEGKHIIPIITCEQEMVNALQRFVSIQKKLGIEPPLLIMLTLLGVSGYTIPANPLRFPLHYLKPHPVDRNTLLIPEIVIDNFDFDAPQVMRPIFDAIWNAAGWPRSMGYDDKGKWM
jgi:hypothetical protein